MNADFAEKLYEFGAGATQIKGGGDGLEPFVVVPNNFKVESLERLRDFPSRVKQTVNVFTPESFVLYYTEFATASSRIFVDSKLPAIIALLDYHVPGKLTDEGTPPFLTDPRWGTHKLNYEFRATKEWNAWKAMDGKNMDQETFAQFIEDNLPDITRPPAAEMLEIAQSLEAKKSVDFSSAIRLTTGAVSFKYEETTTGTGGKSSVEVPTEFELNLQPFEGAEFYVVRARFRYRIGREGLQLRYELVRPYKVVEDAVKGVVAKIGGLLPADVHMLYGAIH